MKHFVFRPSAFTVHRSLAKRHRSPFTEHCSLRSGNSSMKNLPVHVHCIWIVFAIKRGQGFRVESNLNLMKLQDKVVSIHPKTPDEILRVSNSERRLNLVIPLTGFSRKIFAPARKSWVYAEAYIGTPHKKTRRLIPPWRDQSLPRT